LFGAGSNLLKQLSQNGGRWNCINWRDFLIAGAAGVAQGAIIGLAFGFLGPGAALYDYMFIGALSDMLGGMAGRATDIILHGEWDTRGHEIIDPGNLLNDAIGGALGGAIGYGLSGTIGDAPMAEGEVMDAMRAGSGLDDISNGMDAANNADNLLASLKGVNPTGSQTNCMLCSIATDKTRGGVPSVAGT